MKLFMEYTESDNVGVIVWHRMKKGGMSKIFQKGIVNVKRFFIKKSNFIKSSPVSRGRRDLMLVGNFKKPNLSNHCTH